MPCTPNCGACCDPVHIPDWAAQRAFAFGPSIGQLSWMWENWMPVKHVDDGDTVRIICANYDVESRSCLAYETRPPVCRQYPFYGLPEGERALKGSAGKVCGYQADLGRTVLPLVEVRSG